MKKENGVVKNHQVILNLIQDLQRSPLLFMRGRCQIKFGMTSLYKNGGFTLIELLVVVLIIGILAAVAVPQYQLAVAKSRFTQVQTGGDAFIKAYKIYYLANGEDPTTLDDLDFLPFNGTVNDTKKSISNADTTCSILNSYFQFYCVISGVPDWVYYFPTHTTASVRDIRVCRAHSDFEKKVCISAGGTYKSTGDSDKYTDYYLP